MFGCNKIKALNILVKQKKKKKAIILTDVTMNRSIITYEHDFCEMGCFNRFRELHVCYGMTFTPALFRGH